MSLTRKSAIVAVGATATTLLTAGTGKQCAITSLILGNVDGTNDATVTLHLTKSGGSAVDIIADLPVAAGEAVQLFVGGKDSLFLETGDTLSATASAAGDVNATLSYIQEG